MSLTQRRLLFYFFILLFIIVVPIVLLYATGSTINWGRMGFQKTASLIIDSEPAGASIFINGQPPLALSDRLFNRSQAVITKTKLTGMRPGTYTLRLEHNGSLPWEQQITLRPGEVFNTGTLRLFAQAKPVLLAEFPATAVASADGGSLAALDKQTLRIFQIREGKELDLALPAAPRLKELSWSADSESILIGADFVASRDGVLRADLRTALAKTNSVRWDKEASVLYVLTGSELRRVDPQSAESAVVRNLAALGTLIDIEVRSGRVFAVAKNGNRSELVILASNSLESDTRSQLKEGAYRFLNAEQNSPVLLDESRHDLYRIERPLPFMLTYRLTLVSQDYRDGHWSGNELVYATPFELRRWREDEAELLLARWGEPIIDLRRVPTGNQVIFATPTGIHILPSDEQSYRPALRLASLTAFRAFIAVDEKTAFFTGTIDRKTGLFSLEF